MRLKSISKVVNKAKQKLDHLIDAIKEYSEVELIKKCISVLALIAFAALLTHFALLSSLRLQVVQLKGEVDSARTRLEASTRSNARLSFRLSSSAEDIESLKNRNEFLSSEYDRLQEELESIALIKEQYNLLSQDMSETEEFLVNYIAQGGTIEDIGTWKCTAYCTEKRKHICGTGTGITASGIPVTAETSVAINSHNLSWLPFGTKIYIEDVGLRIIQDTGGGVGTRQFDCATTTHEYALRWPGQGTHRAWILREETEDD